MTSTTTTTTILTKTTEEVEVTTTTTKTSMMEDNFKSNLQHQYRSNNEINNSTISTTAITSNIIDLTNQITSIAIIAILSMAFRHSTSWYRWCLSNVTSNLSSSSVAVDRMLLQAFYHSLLNYLPLSSQLSPMTSTTRRKFVPKTTTTSSFSTYHNNNNNRLFQASLLMFVMLTISGSLNNQITTMSILKTDHLSMIRTNAPSHSNIENNNHEISSTLRSINQDDDVDAVADDNNVDNNNVGSLLPSTLKIRSTSFNDCMTSLEKTIQLLCRVRRSSKTSTSTLDSIIATSHHHDDHDVDDISGGGVVEDDDDNINNNNDYLQNRKRNPVHCCSRACTFEQLLNYC